MDSPKFRVAVIGLGLTKFGEHWEKGLRNLALEAGVKAVTDAKIEGKEIDAMFIGNMASGRLTGQEHLGALVADQIGMTIPATRVEAACASGGLALRQGLFSILSGQHNMVLVGGAEKMTDMSGDQVTTTLMGAADEEWEGFQGLTFPGLYALMARRHMHEYGTKREQLAAISVKNHEHGSMNPIAQFKNKITIDQVLNATMVADPLTLLDCSPVSDGAAAMILCREDIAKKYTSNPVYVVGSGQASDSLALAQRKSLTRLDATIMASRAAYKQAGVAPKDINVVEVHDCFTIAELMAVEDLGFAEKGKGAKFIEEGNTKLGGKIPFNTSGGLKACGHPVGATGIKQACEIVMQLRGEAGARQVKGAEIGMTHNVGGSGATAVVHIFKR
ncbi:MAG: thiolase domain-containing protein [Nanoarchaeota archaeon]|nr:thiolase domain-containing protein [Nanoarchaeota archaeon]MBU4300375.1 thiolase domain-containing protein [Nanoarchaeota archaeon]MBU4451455.1 thiolase domain-containing protein [Nanoarchaeota archaeon]MCG2723777.1 thiolase domain-containing protein [archaeon]